LWKKEKASLIHEGIGRATALAFARDGCSNISLGDISLSGLEETRGFIFEKFPSTAVMTDKLDVTDEASVNEFYSKTTQKFGRIDFAANIAGVGHKAAPVHEMPESDFLKNYAVNQKGVPSIKSLVLHFSS